MKFYSDDGYNAPDLYGRNKNESNGLICEHVHTYKKHKIDLALERIANNCLNTLDNLRSRSLTSINGRTKGQHEQT
jgi:hypothetical protein